MDYNFDLDNLDVYKEKAIDLLFQLGPVLLKSIILLLVGRYVIRLIMKVFGNTLVKYEIEPSLATFFKSFLNALLWVLLIISVATTLGMEMTSFVAILGAAGLAIGLALQGSLANFAGGVLILVFKPFRIGDTVEAQGTLGSVESIDILYTKIRNFDNKVVTVPNGALANNSITNYSQKPTRRVEINVGVAYGTDLKKTRNVILEVLKLDERIHLDPEPIVKFVNFGDSSLDLTIRVWTDAANLWPVYWDNMEVIKETLEEHEIEIPFPQRTLHHIYPDGDKK
ncbi:mechanosensitive ion channel family protein [Aquiflexum lacus]|uniref:mechanosensitive ion channel family protein n=1 Tax=Aquiflexum lacus TaxID=2483805 RepID=UPI0018959BA1|nr:mechanosensitive ion channel family protein [Aquiflexum lacus]